MESRIKVTERSIGVRLGEQDAFVRVWAPYCKQLKLVTLQSAYALQQTERGYWQAAVPLRAGDLYRLQIDEGTLLPDPASLSQPEGVHSWSQATDTSYSWTDERWENPELRDYIIYELHVGCYSPEGTLDALEHRLQHLLQLGITAIELMPVGACPGSRNWGYDGVFPFAVQSNYGGAAALQRFVNRCHELGFAVVLDVVYNHMGPEGNYLPEFGPYFTEKYKTPWGAALNFDDAGCDAVRDFFIENALMWLRDFHIDALRLDAVHAIRDFGAEHFLASLQAHVQQLSEHTGRKYHLIAECDLNDSRFLQARDRNGLGMDAQWNDEFHHALRVCAGIERRGYYRDFSGITDLAKAFRDIFVYDGTYSEARQRSFGSSAEGLSADRFVVFSQNHDQTGNRPDGARSSSLHGFPMLRVMAAAVILSPFIPLLFMGEEWAATTPFLYFTDHSDADLIKAVQEGRKQEFAEQIADGSSFFDAQDPEAMLKSKLNWEEIDRAPHRAMLDYYTRLIALRRRLPALHNPDRNSFSVAHDAETQVLELHRYAGSQHAVCLFNFSKDPRSIVVAASENSEILLDSAASEWVRGEAEKELPLITLQPESVVLLSNAYV